ncbi:unnamed protein product [Phyllotreta striolata]|uniref:RNA helicase n=1 Tax=Phyllotreta striolata TaxID=444603 RepID=A0A9N9TMX0_PHYSR|nr:unnamed protein product [Phyllotreta striolata]
MSFRAGILLKTYQKSALIQTTFFSVATKTKIQHHRPLLINCKNKKLNHYLETYYSKLDKVPLASQGWHHPKSKGDTFTINQMQDPEEVMYTLKECNVLEDFKEALKKEGVEKLTEFQYRAINEIRQGSHALLSAETGCGKTLAYLLPIIENLIKDKATNVNTPKALILCPNRELAYQIGDIAKLLGENVGVNVKVLVGGRTKLIMMNPSFDEIDILVATPGAIGKLSTVGIYKLNDVKYTVLDEADTLIDDSFVDRMKGLILKLAQSQIILVSATLPKILPAILEPVQQSLKHVVSPGIHRPKLNITQKFLRLTKSQKPSHLLELAKKNTNPMIIFTNKNETCNWVALFLRENGINCANINGDMHYQIRIDQWNQFLKGEANILSSTDIGSRGLNTIQVKHVLNYDFPLYAADYLHRIGRVGRIGSPTSCKVTNFISGHSEIDMVQNIELAIRRNQQIENVDGNITSLVNRKIMNKEKELIT